MYVLAQKLKHYREKSGHNVNISRCSQRFPLYQAIDIKELCLSVWGSLTAFSRVLNTIVFGIFLLD